MMHPIDQNVTNLIIQTNTSEPIVRSHWSGAAVFQLLFTALTFITNGSVLTLFIAKPRLRTPFTVYLMNLLVANLTLTLANPLRIVELMRTVWFAKSQWCVVLLYSDWLSSGIVLHAHLLITLNRIWAIVWPISYRNGHTKKTAFCICIAMWAYVHAVVLPLYIMDQVRYGEGFESDLWCIINLKIPGQLVYSQVLQVIVYLLPYIAILAAYPFLWYRRSAQTRTVPRQQELLLEETSCIMPKNDQLLQNPVVKKRSRLENSTGFTVLTVQTISLFLCWIVPKIYGTIGTFMDAEIGWLGQLGVIMYLLQIVIDPVLFAIVLSDLRAAIMQTVKCQSCR